MEASKTLISKIIEEVDNVLKSYSIVFKTEKADFDFLTTNKADIRNERTVVSICNLVLTRQFNHYLFEPTLVSQEFYVHFENGLTTSSFNGLEKLVGKKVKNDKWPYCFVDGYFKLNNLFTPKKEQIKHVFVEYKMQNTFDYFDLARDYLKYKCITYKESKETVFVYVIIKKLENYPSIIEGKEPYYQMLDYRISEDSLQHDKNIYVFMPNHENINVKFESIDDVLKTLEETSEITSKIELFQDDDYSSIADEKKKYIEAMPKFNKKVICSRYLKSQYPFIKRVWDESIKKETFNSVMQNFKGDFEVDEIIGTGSSYLSNISAKLNENTKISSIEQGMHASVNKSLFIVSIIDYFCDIFEIDVEKPSYGTRNVRTGSRQKEIKTEDIVKNFKALLAENFSYNNQDNLLKLAYCIMHYIINLYSVLFVIDDDNNVGEFKENFVIFKLIEDLDENLNKLKKQINASNLEFNIEDMIFNKNKENKQIELANALIHYFN